MKGSILQPSFLPWRGVFDLVYKSDVFVFLDDVDYDKHSWRNRNRIKTANGTSWITVPINTAGKRGQKIKDAEISYNTPWKKKILDTIFFSYGKAPFFNSFFPQIEEAFRKDWRYISDLNYHLMKEVMAFLGLKKPLVLSSSLGIQAAEKNERILKICESLAIDHYISGPSAKDYIDEGLFKDRRVSLEYMTYQYPAYRQLHGEFDAQVSVIDLIFNKGAESPIFIWGASNS